MHILITGGTGFIGSALCERLMAEHRLSILTRDPALVARFGSDPPVGFVTELAALNGDAPPQAVINLAGAPIANRRWSKARKALLVASRVGTTTRLVDYLATLNPRPQVLLSASAVGYYGCSEDHSFTEATPPRPGFTHDLCAEWEAEARRAEALGIRVAIARIGLVLGRQGGLLPNLALQYRCCLGGRIGSGRQWMSWIHRDDLVALLLRLLHDPDAQGVWNATAPRPVRQLELSRTLATLVRRPARLWAPGPALRLLLGEMASLLLEGQRVLPERALTEGFEFSYPELGEALAELLARRP